MSQSEYVSYKKLIIFGSEDSGKTSLIQYILTGFFDEKIKKTDECN